MSQQLEDAVTAFKNLKHLEQDVARAEAKLNRRVIRIPQSEMGEYVQRTS